MKMNIPPSARLLLCVMLVPASSSCRNGEDFLGRLSGHEFTHAVAKSARPGAVAAVNLGAHALLGQEDGHGKNPAISPPVDTAASGSSFVAFNAGAVVNARAPTDNMGNAWTLLGQPVVYHGYNGAYDVKAYTALAGRGGEGHSVSIVKDGAPASELTLLFVEILNAARLQDVAQTYADAGPLVTSGSVTTTGPAVLLAVWWGDGYFLSQTVVPDNGFTVIESFLDLPPDSAVQTVAAYRVVDAAGTYKVTWNQHPEQGAVLWLMAFQSGSGDLIFDNGFD